MLKRHAGNSFSFVTLLGSVFVWSAFDPAVNCFATQSQVPCRNYYISLQARADFQIAVL